MPRKPGPVMRLSTIDAPAMKPPMDTKRPPPRCEPATVVPVLDLAYRVAREGDVARPLRLGDEDLQAGEETRGSSPERFEVNLHAWVLPEQNVMLEIEG